MYNIVKSKNRKNHETQENISPAPHLPVSSRECPRELLVAARGSTTDVVQRFPERELVAVERPLDECRVQPPGTLPVRLRRRGGAIRQTYNYMTERMAEI